MRDVGHNMWIKKLGLRFLLIFMVAVTASQLTAINSASAKVTALSNCVITKQDKEFFHYYQKCDKCGWSDHIEYSWAQSHSHGSFESNLTVFHCPNCDEPREIIVFHDGY